MNAVVEHGLQMRTPWYVLERLHLDRFAPEAEAPAIQKYIADDFADRILEDPRDSYKMMPGDGDFWSYPVRLGPDPERTGRAALSSHAMVTTGLRKLYQPHHSRFYAVTTEVFCDRPGLPRPGPRDDLELSVVLRRVAVTFAHPKDIRRRAHHLARSLYKEQHQALDDKVWARVDNDSCDLVAAGLLDPDDGPDRAALGISITEQSWNPDVGWEPVADPHSLAEDEPETRMWALPARTGCPPRSLWFGLVPTFSGEHDRQGRPKLDETAIYQIRCVARRAVRPGHEDCPRPAYVSAPTAPYRLAAFADPEGTAKKRISITMPDLRAVAARAGQPAGPGGVAITAPPRSQFSFDPNGGSPQNGSVVGAAAQTCTYALEIFMIVAMFVFSLFLPIVVFLFQLWWLLALRFCLPPQVAALQALSAHFVTNNKTMNDMTATELTAFDRVVGASGAGQRLKAAPPRLPSGAADAGKDLVAALEPPTAGAGPGPVPEIKPDDPLCTR